MARPLKEIAIWEKQIYDVDIRCLIGGTVADLRNFIQRRHGTTKHWSGSTEEDDFDDSTDGYQFHFKSTLAKDEIFYLWVHNTDENKLFHEVFHLVFTVLSERGATYCEEAEELYAYFGAYIYGKIKEKL